MPNEQYHYAPINITTDNYSLCYVVRVPFTRGDTPYSVGQTISSDVYAYLSADQKAYIDQLEFTAADVNKTYYYCRDDYQVNTYNGHAVTDELTGTTISNQTEKDKIKAVAAKDGIISIKIKSSRMLMAYGFMRKVFEVFEDFKTPVDLVTTSEVGVSLTIDKENKLDEIVTELKKFGSVTVDKNLVIICVVGDMEWDNLGFESSVVEALKDIPVRMISYGGSNYNISILIRKEDKERALRLLSEHLFK